MKNIHECSIYFNLHNQKWSIKQNGIVLGHADEVLLTDVTPKVSQAGRSRVLLELRKNVHAYLKGTVVNIAGWTSYKDRVSPAVGDGSLQIVRGKFFTPITYRPYESDHFFYIDSGTEYTGSKYAFLGKNRHVSVTN